MPGVASDPMPRPTINKRCDPDAPWHGTETGVHEATACAGLIARRNLAGIWMGVQVGGDAR
jgi:hypothetical protein